MSSPDNYRIVERRIEAVKLSGEPQRGAPISTITADITALSVRLP
jgi:hypothetical protein